MPFLEGCSLASTIIGTTLHELTVLGALIVPRCERLVVLFLTIVVSEWSENLRMQDSNVSLMSHFPLPW